MACLKKRGSRFYAQYYVAGKQKRVSLDTDSYQIAKEKVRQLESSLAQGAGSPFPTRTPIAQVLTDFVLHISASRSPRSVRSNVYYLREAFGPVCPAVTVTSRRTTEKARKRSLVIEKGRPRTVPPIEANSFEEVTTSQVSAFITASVRARGLAPKTANRFCEVLCRLYNWAIQQRGIRTPNLAKPESLALLRKVFNDPEKLKPGVTLQTITTEAARQLAEIAQSMRKRGLLALEVAHFLDRMIFCLFAEDVGLLPKGLFSRVLKNSQGDPARFRKVVAQLFEAMAEGGLFGADKIMHFNGNLFSDATVLDMEPEEIEKIAAISTLDWSAVDPSIFGTLFERGLDPDIYCPTVIGGLIALIVKSHAVGQFVPREMLFDLPRLKLVFAGTHIKETNSR